MNAAPSRIYRRPRGALLLALAFLLAGGANAQPGAPSADAPPGRPGESVESPESGESVGLGRLFFSREQRRELDRRRQFNVQEKQEPPGETTLSIDGVVTRSSGKRTVWINGVAQNDDERTSGVAVSTSRSQPGRVVVHPADAPATRAPVGATVNSASGEATDRLGGGRISTRPGAGR